MPGDKSWSIDHEQKTVVYESIKSEATLVKKWDAFERDVTTNPYFHSKPRRIKKLKGKTSYPEGAYRYRNDPLRVVYYPEPESAVIYPLEAAKVTDISYKKKTKGR